MKDRLLNIIKFFFSLKFNKFFREIHVIIDEIIYRTQGTKKPVLSYPPRHITVLINGYCTNSCTFCVHHSPLSKNSFSKHLYKPKFRLSFDEFKNIVDKSYKARVPHIHICAMGEPLLHKEFTRFLDYTISKYGKVSFQTNFHKKLFEKKNVINEIIKRKNNISYITTDILSADKNQHNEIKKGSDFDYIINSMSYISKKAPKINFKIHLILTKYNYKNISNLVELLAKKNINGQLDVVNLHPYNYENDKFTAVDSVYQAEDNYITDELKKADETAKKLNFKLNIPKPFGTKGKKCGVFWSRLQVNFVLTENGEIEFGIGNSLPGDCNAVVRGNLRSVGNIIQEDTLWDLWNGEKLVKIRTDLINNIYPDEACKNCQNYIK